MRIIYIATSEIAVETLYTLKENHEVICVITQPDKPEGRKKILTSTPIGKICEKENLTLIKASKFNPDLIEKLKSFNANLFITFSFGVILRKDFFTITKSGGINIHPSLLPELRGPSPIKTAILQGKKKSGITIQKVALKIDSGDILMQKEFEIDPSDDYLTIKKLVSNLSSKMILDVLDNIENNKIYPVGQNESEATYCRLIKKDDGKIDWNDRGEMIINKIRAFISWPVAYTYINDKRINIYKAHINTIHNFSDFQNEENGKIVLADKKNGIVVKTSECLINIEKLQQKGKKQLNYIDFLNGFRNLQNNILVSEPKYI